MEIIVVIVLAAALLVWLLIGMGRNRSGGRQMHEVEEARGLPRRGKEPPPRPSGQGRSRPER